VAWNAHRGRWIMIFVQEGGASYLGEVWYAEADAPTGPWGAAVKVASHERYSFYNPKHQPMFDKDGGRFIFFEGTYTHTFSGNPDATPRYDYNQMMYKLDLAHPRLKLPPPNQ
jgi:hypothetical protein